MVMWAEVKDPTYIGIRHLEDRRDGEEGWRERERERERERGGWRGI